MPSWNTITDLAQQTGLTRQRLAAWAREGKVKAERDGPRAPWRIDADDLAAVIAAEGDADLPRQHPVDLDAPTLADDDWPRQHPVAGGVSFAGGVAPALAHVHEYRLDRGWLRCACGSRRRAD